MIKLFRQLRFDDIKFESTLATRELVLRVALLQSQKLIESAKKVVSQIDNEIISRQ